MEEHNNKSAFTLVELAIVLIIIGLITGGVVGAQSLIESAERQAIIKEIKSFGTAINAFRLEYDALPGDFDEAEEYWGASNTGNGNGDNIIKTVHPIYEEIGFWNHLGNAELINQKFNDNNTHDMDPNTPEIFLPRGPIDNAYWGIDVFLTHNNWDDTPFHNSMLLSLFSIDQSYNRYFALSQNPSMSSNSIYKIDKKIDDGMPFNGLVGMIGFNSGGSALNSHTAECHTNRFPASTTEITYNLSGSEADCAPLFILQYPNGNLSNLF